MFNIFPVFVDFLPSPPPPPSPGEVFLGLDQLHQLTNSANYTLNITMVDYDNSTFHAVFDDFKVVLLKQAIFFLICR